MIPVSGADVRLLGVTNVIEKKTALIRCKPRELKPCVESITKTNPLAGNLLISDFPR